MRGQLSKIFHAGAVLEAWSRRAGAISRDEWQAAGRNGFIANLTPVEEDIVDAVRSLVTRLFATPAQTAGKSRWGFKEVRYGAAEALFLHRLFPFARLVHVIRDPRDVLCSLDHWERERSDIWNRDSTEAAVMNWLHVSETLLQLKNDGATFMLSLRYEDLVAGPDPTIRNLAGHVGLEVKHLDRSVLKHRVHQEGLGREAARVMRSWSDLPEDLRELLRQERIRRTALAFGYVL